MKTDNEIIKALERMSEEDPDGFSNDILDLIKRLHAENEELRKGFTADFDYFASEYDSKIKSEARKEFAERLKEMPSVINCEYEWLHTDIDNLLKEMESKDNEY